MIDLLVADETNPRSVAFQAAVLEEHLRTAVQLADFVELCSMPVERRREKFDSLLSDILEQTGQLAEAIAQLYFSHAVVTQEVSGFPEDSQT